MVQIEPTAYNRLFYRLKVQALIKDLRQKFGDEEAFNIIGQAVGLEAQHRADDDRQHNDMR